MLIYTCPYPFVYSGIFLLAIGYGFDLNERVGCEVFPFGLIAAPCFPGATIAVMMFAQHRRRVSGRRFGDSRMPLGRATFMTWTDLLVDRDDDDDVAHDDGCRGLEPHTEIP
mmetsp:Transcript_36227/g.89273  ORF Transcript_36227/g.89273 Transcript_36227/m.89273 type:complete len:112 (-) Transcript_36227:214-549(-)